MKQKLTNILSWMLTIVIVLLALFSIYQILRIVFGGSWSTEDAILVIVGLNFTASLSMVGYLFTIQKSTLTNTFKTDNLQKSFNALATDFKEHKKEFHDFKLEMIKFKFDTTNRLELINKKPSQS